MNTSLKRSDEQFLAGVLLAGAGACGMALTSLLPRERRVELGAVELAFIACSYPAMAFKDGSAGAVVGETLLAGAFLGCAWLGLARGSRRTVAAGLFAHAALDAVHHRRQGVGPGVPAWFPPGCAIADVLLALPLVR